MTLAIRLVAMIIGLQWAVTEFGQPAEAQVKPLLEEARALERADEFAKALSLRESALTIQLAIPGVALSEEVNLNLFFMGRNARLLDRKDTALSYLQRSLAISEKLHGKESADGASTLFEIAKVYGGAHGQGDVRQSREYLERAIAAFEKSKGLEYPDLVDPLFHLSQAQRKLGDVKQSIDAALRGYAIQKTTQPENQLRLGYYGNFVGMAYDDAGDFKTARDWYQQSLSLREAVPTSGDAVALSILNNLALLNMKSGDGAAAVADFEKILAKIEKLGSGYRNLRATTLVNMSVAEGALGRYESEIRHIEEAVAIFHSLYGGDGQEYLASLNTLGAAYGGIGQFEKGKEAVLKALAGFRRIGLADTEAVAIGVFNLSALQRELKEGDGGLENKRRAIGILEKRFGTRHPDLPRMLNGLALQLHEVGEMSEARTRFVASLQLSNEIFGPNHPDSALTWFNLASLEMDEKRLVEAMDGYMRTAALSIAAGRPETLWTALSGMREVSVRMNERDAAIFYGKLAVNVLQDLRRNVSALGDAASKSFLGGEKTYAYRALADLLIEAGRISEAQQVLAMLKEEEYFEFIRRDENGRKSPSRAGFGVIEQDKADRYSAAGRRLELAYSPYARLRAVAPADAPAVRLAELDKARLVLEEAVKTFAATNAEIARIFLAAGSAPKDGRLAPETAGTLRARVTARDPGAALLQYLVTDRRVSMVLAKGDTLIARSVDVSEKELFSKAQALREALQRPNQDPTPAARVMYDLLIAPIAADLEALAPETLVFSLDGVLRYLPMAALYDGNRYLVERYRVVGINEAVDATVEDKGRQVWRLAGLGLTRGIGTFSALPAVREELDGVLGGARPLLPGEVWFDQAFDANRVKLTLGGGFQVVHIASHFMFRPGNESNSFLLLGDGDQLTLQRVRTAGYSFKGVDLVALSACDTAVGGGRDANGREVEGFATLVQRQGAASVLATLWAVADRSTALLMRAFYQARAGDAAGTKGKADALRSAQLALLRGEVRGESSGANRGIDRPAGQGAGFVRDPRRPFAHPYYWAPFVMMGDWQ